MGQQNIDKMAEARHMFRQAFELVKLYEAEVVVPAADFEFALSPEQVTAVKQAFGALRTQIKAALDSVTA
jgi:hypothetical protein